MTTARTTARTCLFGGAIFAAGLSASAAMGQGLAHSTESYALIVAERVNGVVTLLKPYADSPVGIPDISYASGDFSGTVSVGTHRIECSLNRSTSLLYNYCIVGAASAVHPLTDSLLNISWDFGAWQGGYVIIEDKATSTIVWINNSTAGAESFAAERGRSYQIAIALGGSAAGGQAYGRVELAEPCAGDIDGNGMLNVEDVQAFVDAFLNGCP